jgi:hypothetical protein
MSARELTVAVVVLAGGAALERCLAALRPMPADIVVIGRLDAAQRDATAAAGTRVIDSDEPVPRRRARALAQTTTRWIAFCEDTCEPAAGWFAAFEAARVVPQADAWSGPITLRDDLPARCLALGALEYGEFAPLRWPRLATGEGAPWRPMARLAGLNLLYRTAALATLVPAHGLVETEVHAALRAAGRGIALHPGLAVTYSASDFSGARCSSRLQHGRIYGGGLRAQLGVLGRAVALLKCAALPVVLWARGAAALPAARRADWHAHGWLGLLALAWSAGEATGIVFGRGRSLQAWQ